MVRILTFDDKTVVFYESRDLAQTLARHFGQIELSFEIDFEDEDEEKKETVRQFKSVTELLSNLRGDIPCRLIRGAGEKLPEAEEIDWALFAGPCKASRFEGLTLVEPIAYYDVDMLEIKVVKGADPEAKVESVRVPDTVNREVRTNNGITSGEVPLKTLSGESRTVRLFNFKGKLQVQGIDYQLAPFKKLDSPVPSSPGFFEHILCCDVRGKDEPSVMYTVGADKAWQVENGLVIGYADLAPIDSYFSVQNQAFWVDPQHNFRILDRYVFAEQVVRPCYCDPDKYPVIEIRFVDGRHEVHHYSEDGKSGGRVAFLHTTFA